MNSPKLPKRAEAGVVVGGYELVRRIGRGGMAEVWVARRALGQKGTKFVAIKLIADHYVGDERYTRMFRAEAELAAILSHANIVQVFDEGEEDGRSYLVMEWVDGLNLLKLGAVLALLDDEQRRFKVTSYIIGQLLYALGYAHSITSFDGSPLGVVHRDVSPQNVLVSNHGEVKLTDFGVAHTTMEESSGIHVKGKVRYMAPEQLAGKTRSPTVDLYAVGALLHELLDGKKFRGEYEGGQEMFAAVLAGEIPPLSRPAPPELEELRVRLLQPDPDHRIKSAEEAVTWLKRYPGHGDARSELTKLCGSLTGVVRPRAGPGQSTRMPMADRKTAQFQGLAKPKVNLPGGVNKVPPPIPGKAAGIRTSSTTAVKSPSRSPQIPVISGGTEFVRPQAPPQASKKRVVRSVGPRSVPPPAVEPTTVPLGGAAAAVRAQAAVAPVVVAPVPSASPVSPVGVVPAAVQGQASNPIPVSVPGQASNPIPVPVPAQATPAPAYVSGQASNPIPTPVAQQGSYPAAGHGGPEGGYPAAVHGPQLAQQPVSLQPSSPISVVPSSSPRLQLASTERLPNSETSGAAPLGVAGGTEVIDANMLAEISSGGSTDNDIHPQVMPHEGTDTSREIPRGAPQPYPTAQPKGLSTGAIVGIVFGLIVIALLSVVVTLLVFKDGPGGEEDVAGKGGAAAGSQAAGSQAAAESPSEGELAAASKEEAPAESASEGAKAGEAENIAVDAAGAAVQGDVVPGPGDSSKDEAGDPEPEQHSGTEPTEPEPEPEPEPAPEPKAEESEPEAEKAAKTFPPRVFVKGPAGAEVRIGTTVIKVPGSGRVTKHLKPGSRQRVSWRPGTNFSWRIGSPVDLVKNRTVKFYVSQTELRRR